MKINLNPADPESVAFELHRAVKQSGLTHQQIVDRLDEKYGEKISVSALSHTIWRGTARFYAGIEDFGCMWGEQHSNHGAE